MGKSNAELIRRANNEVMTEGRLNVLDQFFANDYVVHAGDKDYKGHGFIRRFVKQLHSAMPDLRVVDVEILCETPDKVTWQRTLTGKHMAALKGIPASGKKVTWQEMFVTRFDGDKIAEEWMVSNLAGQLMLKLPRK
ncbi:MAG: ester cyclase [Phycisphaerales bacterium]|nr:ester cyclase [Phycisphaerales bacterium]MCB9862280.1 ester cyclase [Phycisphaerales bacterium]